MDVINSRQMYSFISLTLFPLILFTPEFIGVNGIDLQLHELSSLTRAPDQVKALKLKLLQQIKEIDNYQCFPKVLCGLSVRPDINENINPIPSDGVSNKLVHEYVDLMRSSIRRNNMQKAHETKNDENLTKIIRSKIPLISRLKKKKVVSKSSSETSESSSEESPLPHPHFGHPQRFIRPDRKLIKQFLAQKLKADKRRIWKSVPTKVLLQRIGTAASTTASTKSSITGKQKESLVSKWTSWLPSISIKLEKGSESNESVEPEQTKRIRTTRKSIVNKLYDEIERFPKALKLPQMTEIDAFKTAVEVGGKLKDPEQCDFLYNGCPISFDQMIQMIAQMRLVLRASDYFKEYEGPNETISSTTLKPLNKATDFPHHEDFIKDNTTLTKMAEILEIFETIKTENISTTLSPPKKLNTEKLTVEESKLSDKNEHQAEHLPKEREPARFEHKNKQDGKFNGIIQVKAPDKPQYEDFAYSYDAGTDDETESLFKIASSSLENGHEPLVEDLFSFVDSKYDTLGSNQRTSLMSSHKNVANLEVEGVDDSSSKIGVEKPSEGSQRIGTVVTSGQGKIKILNDELSKQIESHKSKSTFPCMKLEKKGEGNEVRNKRFPPFTNLFHQSQLFTKKNEAKQALPEAHVEISGSLDIKSVESSTQNQFGNRNESNFRQDLKKSQRDKVMDEKSKIGIDYVSFVHPKPNITRRLPPKQTPVEIINIEYQTSRPYTRTTSRVRIDDKYLNFYPGKSVPILSTHLPVISTQKPIHEKKNWLKIKTTPISLPDITGDLSIKSTNQQINYSVPTTSPRPPFPPIMKDSTKLSFHYGSGSLAHPIIKSSVVKPIGHNLMSTVWLLTTTKRPFERNPVSLQPYIANLMEKASTGPPTFDDLLKFVKKPPGEPYKVANKKESVYPTAPTVFVPRTSTLDPVDEKLKQYSQINFAKLYNRNKGSDGLGQFDKAVNVRDDVATNLESISIKREDFVLGDHMKKSNDTLFNQMIMKQLNTTKSSHSPEKLSTMKLIRRNVSSNFIPENLNESRNAMRVKREVKELKGENVKKLEELKRLNTSLEAYIVGISNGEKILDYLESEGKEQIGLNLLPLVVNELKRKRESRRRREREERVTRGNSLLNGRRRNVYGGNTKLKVRPIRNGLKRVNVNKRLRRRRNRVSCRRLKNKKMKSTCIKNRQENINVDRQRKRRKNVNRILNGKKRKRLQSSLSVQLKKNVSRRNDSNDYGKKNKRTNEKKSSIYIEPVFDNDGEDKYVKKDVNLQVMTSEDIASYFKKVKLVDKTNAN